MSKLLYKIKNKDGGTHLVEILISVPIIIFVMFLPISFYQLSQQQNYVEDVKTLLVQDMSRDGDLTTTEINNKWKPLFEKEKGIKVKSITPIENKVTRDIKTPMTTEIVVTLKPSFFSFLLGGDYKTTAIIYSEYIS